MKGGKIILKRRIGASTEVLWPLALPRAKLSGEGMVVGTWSGEGNPEFLGKIRKRREKIVGKGLLETSRFERELKRLECSVNYEGDTKKKGPTQVNDRSKRKVIKSVIRNQKVDLFCIQETKMQVMSEEVVRSLGSGRFLDWKVLNAMGTTGGVLICWNKRSLEMLGVEEGQFSISCRFRNVGDGAIWVFTGVYGPFSRDDRECLWEEFGAIRGFGGLNNQSWARLDRFLATPSWLDQYSRVHQRRLPRPTSDHFPVLLEGGGLRRGPSPFKFENMWLKAKGFKDLIEGWWQGIEVFGRLEKNKVEALQQVERWDLVEEERNLTKEELVGVDGRSALETAIKGIMAKGRG
ncbi:hypothetical protein AAG906_033319 [Vitis piasezkii]